MANVQFSDITDGCPDGQGVFDQLMKSVKAHLKEEYDAQRIRGSEYTQVYLNGLQTAMGQAIQWQLGAEIAKNQALLISAQIEGQEKQTELVAAQVDLAEQQLLNLQQDLVNNKIQEDILSTQNETGQYQLDNILPAQKDKTESEAAILTQKIITEEAQTKDVTSQGPVTGIMGRQRDLYQNQAEGFIRDGEQKAARILSDVWGINYSADVAGEATPDNVAKTNMDSMLGKLRENSGLGTYTPFP